MKQWAKSVMDEGKKRLEKRLLQEQDKTEKQKLQNDLVLMDKVSLADSFSDHADGSTSLVTSLPFVDVKIGDFVAVTDEKSQFTISGLEKGEYPIILSYKGYEFYQSTIKIENSGQKNVVLNISGGNIWGAADIIQQSMYGTQNVTAQNIYFPDYGVDNKVPWSVGDGEMWVRQDPNIVACNKADNWSSDGSYETSLFPNNNSDCAQSIGYGYLYANNPDLYGNYYMSYNCFLEAIGSMTGEGSNPYCNGKLKDGHVNCSWFYGIWDTETLHAHN